MGVWGRQIQRSDLDIVVTLLSWIFPYLPETVLTLFYTDVFICPETLREVNNSDSELHRMAGITTETLLVSTYFSGCLYNKDIDSNTLIL